MRREGFSLVEISVVLVIVATMLAGVLPAITESQKSNASEETAERMEAVKQAILTFRAANSRVPCPSDISLGVNTANFGKEAANPGTCAGGTPATNGTDGVAVVWGGVPTKTLGLPDEYAFDGWGRRMVLHMTYGLTSTAGYAAATTGNITVKDAAASNRTTTAAYALVSHGPNGHGGFTRAGGGTRFSFGTTNAQELENCDCTSAAANGTYNSTLYQYMATPATNPQQSFDDIVIYGSRVSLDLLAGAGTSYWMDAGSNNIRNTNTNSVGIGTTSPSTIFRTTIDQGASLNGLLLTSPIASVIAQRISAPGAAYIDFNNTAAAVGAKYFRIGNKAGLLSIEQVNDAYSASTDLMAVTSTGNVGIGTALPIAKLQVQSAATGILSEPLYIVRPDETTLGTAFGNNANGAIRVGSTTGSRWALGVTTQGGDNRVVQTTHNGFSQTFDYQGTELMRITTTGNVGIGTTTPQANLDVAGGVKVGTTAAACTAAIAGTLRYNAGAIEFCNGTAWGGVGGSGSVTPGTICGINDGTNPTILCNGGNPGGACPAGYTHKSSQAGWVCVKT